MKKTFLKLSLLLLVPFFTACSEEQNTDSTEEVVSGVVESTDEVAEAVSESVEATSEEVQSAITETSFEEGSWGYSILYYFDTESETGDKVFDLDEITLTDGDESTDEELSEAADKQLMDLSTLLKSHPNAKAEIQGHSKEGSNAIGKKAKKGWSKAKAFFVRKKLIANGVSEDQLRHEGYGDEFLLEGVDGKDASQNRITVKFSK